MATKPKDPCVGCERKCNYSQCALYKSYISQCWDMYRQTAAEMRRGEIRDRPRKPNTWRYQNPALIREYLATPPCNKCNIQEYCPDDRSCPTYDRWVQDRWKMIRNRLRK